MYQDNIAKGKNLYGASIVFNKKTVRELKK